MVKPSSMFSEEKPVLNVSVVDKGIFKNVNYMNLDSRIILTDVVANFSKCEVNLDTVFPYSSGLICDIIKIIVSPSLYSRLDESGVIYNICGDFQRYIGVKDFSLLDRIKMIVFYINDSNGGM